MRSLQANKKPNSPTSLKSIISYISREFFHWNALPIRR